MKDDKPELRTLRSGRTTSRRHGSKVHGRIGALLVFGSIAVLIAKQEIPVIDSWITRLLDEDGWHAAEQCRALARHSTGQEAFTRLLRAGKVQRTGGGFYVSGVVLALLDNDGREHTWHFSCNVSRAGEVLAINSSVVRDAARREPQRGTVTRETFRDP
jgi:hypothetical protein